MVKSVTQSVKVAAFTIHQSTASFLKGAGRYRGYKPIHSSYL
jgi:hypothetical protein